MPKKQPVVKSESVAAVAAVGSALPIVRKRTVTKKRTPAAVSHTATEAPAPASDDKKAPRSRKKTEAAIAAGSATTAAVTHRHKKESVPTTTATMEQPSAPAPVSAPAPKVHAPYHPPQEEIAKLAYSYFVARGYQPGDPRSDWFRAEQELKARHAASLIED